MNLKSFIAASCCLLSAFSIFAEEGEKKSNFPGKPGVEFTQTLNNSTIGKTIADTEYSPATSAVYSNTCIRASVTFPVTAFYKVTPWVKDGLEVFFNPVKTSDKTNLDTAVTGRNRADLGIDNTFMVKDIINISVTPVVRFENTLFFTAKDTKHKEDKYEAAARLIIMPQLVLCYKYGFGFDWSLKNVFNSTILPAMSDTDTNSVYESFQYCGTYELGFDILKALKVADYSFRIFGYDKVQPKFFTDNYVSDVTYDGKKYSKKGEFNNEAIVGFTGGYKTVSLKLGYYNYLKNDIDNYDNNGSTVWSGVQAGCTVIVNGWTFGMTYTGVQQVWLAYDAVDNKSRAVKDSDNKYWENNVEAYLKFAL